MGKKTTFTVSLWRKVNYIVEEVEATSPTEAIDKAKQQIWKTDPPYGCDPEFIEYEVDRVVKSGNKDSEEE